MKVKSLIGFFHNFEDDLPGPPLIPKKQTHDPEKQRLMSKNNNSSSDGEEMFSGMRSKFPKIPDFDQMGDLAKGATDKLSGIPGAGKSAFLFVFATFR